MSEKGHEKDINKAMSIAIAKTLTSVLGSSLTTIAGFLALCGMNLTLGKDIGIVMAKGVLFGLICVVTVLPALILVFNSIIDKSHHKEIIPKFKHISNFVIKHHNIVLVIFIIMLFKGQFFKVASASSVGNEKTSLSFKNLGYFT